MKDFIHKYGEIISVILYMIGLFFAFGVYYIWSDISGATYVRASLASLPGAFLAFLFKDNIVIPIILTIIFLVGGFLISRYSKK